MWFHSVVENLSLNANSLSLKNLRNLIPGYEPEIYETAHDPDEVIFFLSHISDSGKSLPCKKNADFHVSVIV